MNYWKNKIGTN